jgi:hypothetical protein
MVKVVSNKKLVCIGYTINYVVVVASEPTFVFGLFVHFEVDWINHAAGKVAQNKIVAAVCVPI